MACFRIAIAIGAALALCASANNGDGNNDDASSLLQTGVHVPESSLDGDGILGGSTDGKVTLGSHVGYDEEPLERFLRGDTLGDVTLPETTAVRRKADMEKELASMETLEAGKDWPKDLAAPPARWRSDGVSDMERMALGWGLPEGAESDGQTAQEEQLTKLTNAMLGSSATAKSLKASVQDFLKREQKGEDQKKQAEGNNWKGMSRLQEDGLDSIVAPMRWEADWELPETQNQKATGASLGAVDAFNAVDSNHDGQVSQEEFVSATRVGEADELLTAESYYAPEVQKGTRSAAMQAIRKGAGSFKNQATHKVGDVYAKAAAHFNHASEERHKDQEGRDIRTAATRGAVNVDGLLKGRRYGDRFDNEKYNIPFEVSPSIDDLEKELQGAHAAGASDLTMRRSADFKDTVEADLERMRQQADEEEWKVEKDTAPRPPFPTVVGIPYHSLTQQAELQEASRRGSETQAELEDEARRGSETEAAQEEIRQPHHHHKGKHHGKHHKHHAAKHDRENLMQ